MGNKKGFTLIELLVVVGIIGLLASIAIPMYHSYIYKSRSSELFNFAGKMKSDVAELLLLEGSNSITATSCQNIATSSGTVNSDITQSWAVSAACIITVTSVANTIGSGQLVLTLTPSLEADGSLSWACSASDDEYVPSTCK